MQSGSGKWALVTGASGFLGSRLVRRLVERGECVKGFVRPGSNLKYLEGLPEDRFRIAVGDVRCDHTIFRALSGCDRMYHVAATYSFSETARRTILDDSVLGAQAACEAARRAGLDKVVFTSSAATLGVSSKAEPMVEGHEFNLRGAHAYGEAKHEAEQVALDGVERGLPIVIVQPTVVVGPGDWKPTPSGNMLLSYLKLSPSFRVPVMPGGFCYVDVDDVAEGHIAAMEKGKVGERYLLGGDNLENREFYEILSDITGLAEPGKEQGSGSAKLVASVMELSASLSGTAPLVTRKLVDNYFGKYVFVNSEKAERELGYTHRPAREALSRAVRWFLDNDYVPERAARRVRLELRPV